MRVTSPLLAALGLVLLAGTLPFGCDDTKLKAALPPGARIDTFSQVTVGKVDILWVIDNSSSTSDKQENLARNFGRFFDYLAQAKVDYHIAVTTTDVTSTGPGAQGRLFGTPAVITPDTPKPLDAFRKNATVGTAGSGNESGLDAARRTLELKPAGFLRPEAFLFLVFVSDDEDHSEPGTAKFFYRYFEGQKGKGNEQMVSAGAIVGDSPDGCFTPAGGQARAGKRYSEVVNLVGGRTGSICSEQFDGILKEMGVDAVGLKRKFALSIVPDVTSIEVTMKVACDAPKPFLDATCTKVGACTDNLLDCTVKQQAADGTGDGWSFEPATNSLIFNGQSLPPKGAEIDVLYFEPGKKPS